MTQAVASESQAIGTRAAFLNVPDPAPRKGWQLLLSFDGVLVRHILRVALPVVLGMMTQTAINILDTVMVGRLPKDIANPGQAAIGLALPMMWLVGGFLSALWVGTQAITSRRAGEGNDLLAGRTLTNSLAIAVVGSLALSGVAMFAAPFVIEALYQDPAVISLGVEYLQIRLLGILAMVSTFSFKSFFDGIGKTHVFMVAAVIMNILNVGLNFLLIYGYEPWSVPSYGVAGAAWASVISAYIGTAIMLVWSLAPIYLRRYRYYRPSCLNMRVIGEIVRLSLPNGAATLVVMVGFVAFYWVVGQVNARYVVEHGLAAGNPVIAAANQVLVTTIMVGFMSALAVGSATAAIVSQALGAKRVSLAERYGWEAAKLWAIVMWLLGAIMVAFPEAVLSLSTLDADVIAAGRVPLQLLGTLQGVIAVAIVFAQTLYGVGEAKFVMYVEFGLHLFVMAPAAYAFGIGFDLGLVGVYVGPSLYVCLLCLATTWRFSRGSWKHIVI